MCRKITILFLIILFFPVGIFAVAVDDLKADIAEREKEISRLEEEIAEYSRSLEDQSKFSKTLKNEVKRLETQIAKLNADIRWTEAQLNKTELRIDELGSDIETSTREIEVGKAIVAELIQALHETDSISIIEILLSYNSISEFLNEREYNFRVNKDLEREIRKQHKRKKVLEEELRTREAEEVEFVAYKRDLSGRREVQKSVNNEKSELLSDSQNEEDRYQKLLREREEKRLLIQEELVEIEEKLRAEIDPTKLPPKREGVLSWPVTDPVITQGFGLTKFATTYGTDIYKGKGHNGIDFRGPVGARIIAAEDGVVVDFGDTDKLCRGGSYGKWIVIKHPNNLTTLYAHLSAIRVDKNQQVSKGDLIGYSGSSGYVTGPHLHFTVYASDTYKLSKTRVCGMVPTGGFINPLDYLG
jgi:murein DD-endopeptidase MepM/ murein hydrolase activator NlpD